MKKVLGLIFAASVVLAAPLAHAKEAVPAAKRVEQPAPVSVTLSAWSVTLDKAGKERFKRAESAKPGDVIEYRAELRNVSRATLKDQALTLPVPPGTAYVPSSARPAQAQARADGGKFEAMPLMRVERNAQGQEEKSPCRPRLTARCAGR
ncbi:hypothetical protein WJ970_13015 [Achromobacter xylosoxidans]